MDMPIAQTPVGIVPWIVSIWVDGDARYWLWGLGIGLDLWALVTESGERRLEQSQQRLDRMLTMRSQRSEKTIERDERQGGRNREFPTTITPLKGDVAHRSERMALFILIVLGEGIVQLTVAAEASEHWNRGLLRRGHRRVFFSCARCSSSPSRAAPPASRCCPAMSCQRDRCGWDTWSSRCRL